MEKLQGWLIDKITEQVYITYFRASRKAKLLLQRGHGHGFSFLLQKTDREREKERDKKREKRGTNAKVTSVELYGMTAKNSGVQMERLLAC